MAHASASEGLSQLSIKDIYYDFQAKYFQEQIFIECEYIRCLQAPTFQQVLPNHGRGSEQCGPRPVSALSFSTHSRPRTGGTSYFQCIHMTHHVFLWKGCQLIKLFRSARKGPLGTLTIACCYQSSIFDTCSYLCLSLRQHLDSSPPLILNWNQASL